MARDASFFVLSAGFARKFTSVIFRTIKSFAPVDAAVANEVNGEAHRFVPALSESRSAAQRMPNRCRS